MELPYPTTNVFLILVMNASLLIAITSIIMRIAQPVRKTRPWVKLNPQKLAKKTYATALTEKQYPILSAFLIQQTNAYSNVAITFTTTLTTLKELKTEH